MESSLFLRNRGDWRSTEPSGLDPDYRVVAHAATLALLQSLSSQGFSFFVSTLEALNFQPEGLAVSLANPSADALKRCKRKPRGPSRGVVSIHHQSIDSDQSHHGQSTRSGTGTW